ncbi:hypothetical protein NDU88_004491 [Pleurodeles waltl]|uniref:Uncharacterized protein n=1 Tax=Pleurodeles waltl TaxID=8319 RepID=A0AAV7LLH6_PLEWA|nr:hypothetical protein NDU88_004491 [Pleurodeles waltl]
MCRSTPRSASRTPRNSETRQIQAPGEVLGGRLRHWGRAALELRRDSTARLSRKCIYFLVQSRNTAATRTRDLRFLKCERCLLI